MKKIAIFWIWVLLILNLNAQDNCLSFTESQNDIGINSASFGAGLGDFNGDGWLDAVVVQAYDRIEIHFGKGDGTIDTTSVIYGEDRWRYGVNVFDIDGDGDLDFITIPFYSTSDYGIEVWENNGSGIFTLKTDQLARYNSGEIADVGDVDGDGDLDIVFPSDNHGFYVLKNDGNGNFSEWQNYDNNSDFDNVVLFDADNDGDLDAIFTASTGATGDIMVYFNDGNGTFTPSGQLLSPDNIEAAAVGDIDNDGDMDIIMLPWSGNPAILLNDGLGTFIPGDTLQEDYFYNDGFLIDLNKDNLPDLVTDANIWMNSPDTPGHFILQNYSFSGSSHDMTYGDINNDGFLDVYYAYFGSSSGDKVYLYNKPYELTQDTTICPGDTITFGNQIITDSGSYYVAISCDTVINLNVDLYPSINTEVTVENGTLTAVAEGVDYQWFNCDNNQLIDGATEQSFSPDSSGNYAVILSNGTCSFVSDCYFVEVPASVKAFEFEIYPNPVENQLFINAKLKAKGQILTLNGKTLMTFDLNKGKNAIDLRDLSQGMYILKIRDNSQTAVYKIFVK